MKKIFTILALFLSLYSYSQLDSSKMKVSITVQARECEILLNFTYTNHKMEELDSVMLVKFRPPATAPTNNTNVQLDSIPVRGLLEAAQHLSVMPAAMRVGSGGGSPYKRFTDACLLVNNGWLTFRINKLIAENDAEVDAVRLYGRKRGKKEID